MNDKELHTYCEAWVTWCFKRRLYVKPAAQTVLGRLHPSRVRPEPNARNIANMQFFNTAVLVMAEMPENAARLKCFKAMFVEKADPIKRQADTFGISRPTYYARARRFAREAFVFAEKLQRINAIASAPELEEVD